MNRDPLVLAYLAGVIDSDGYISTQRTHHSERIYTACKVGIAGTRRQPHDLAALLFGGNVSRYEPKNPRHRAQYQWSRCGLSAYDVILAIRPYLRIKREHADLALELQDVVAELPYFWPARPDDWIDAIHEQIRALNQPRRASHVETP
jgi:hypothetical protein